MNVTRTGALVVTCAWLGLAGPSAADAQTAIEVDYDHVHRTTLDNGLEVVVVEAPSVPIVTIELAVRNGAFTEEPEFNGLSHLYEHMFFKANESIPSQEEYLARQRELGMVWNGTTGNERVNYFFTLQSRNLEAGMEFMRAAIQTPVFREDELVREREVVLGEYDRNEADPGYWLWDASDALLWTAYPERKDALGDRASISAATVEQMEWMQETYYIPNNSLLVLSGDVTADEGFALAESVFGAWERGPDPFETYPIPEHPRLTDDAATVVGQDVQVSVVTLSWHGPDTRTDVEATYAADVFSFILGQTGSTFQENLVDSGLVLQAGLSYQTNRYVGPIVLSAVIAPGREEEALAAITAEIDRFDDPGYFTDEQIQTAQTLLAIDDLYTQQRTDDLAHTLSYWWASASLDYYLGYVSSLAAVTREDIQAYVETYIVGQPRVGVLMSNEAHLERAGIDDAWLLDHIGREVE